MLTDVRLTALLNGYPPATIVINNVTPNKGKKNSELTIKCTQYFFLESSGTSKKVSTITDIKFAMRNTIPIGNLYK